MQTVDSSRCRKRVDIRKRNQAGNTWSGWRSQPFQGQLQGSVFGWDKTPFKIHQDPFKTV